VVRAIREDHMLSFIVMFCMSSVDRIVAAALTAIFAVRVSPHDSIALPAKCGVGVHAYDEASLALSAEFSQLSDVSAHQGNLLLEDLDAAPRMR
jgi:hypothetical protein